MAGYAGCKRVQPAPTRMASSVSRELEPGTYKVLTRESWTTIRKARPRAVRPTDFSRYIFQTRPILRRRAPFS